LLPIVIYNGEKKLKSAREFSELIEKNIGVVERYIPKFEYFSIDLTQLDSVQLRELIEGKKNEAALIFSIEKIDGNRLEDLLKYIKIIKDHISKEIRETLMEYLTVILSSNPNIPEEIKEQVEDIKGEPAMLPARLDRGFNKIKKNAY